MVKSNLTTLGVLLIILGFIFRVDHTEGVWVTLTNNNKCRLEVETADLQVPLSPAVCGQSSVTVTNVERGICKENGDDCVSWHNRHEEKLIEQCCLANAKNVVTDTVTVSGSGCSQSVTYRFTNITDCRCKYIQISALEDY
jgi:hypothetical protein